MNPKAFKEWLYNKGIYTNEKLIRDCVSRAHRVERAFQATRDNFSFENEFSKDRGAEIIKLISRRGIEIKEPVDLPLGTNQMDTISCATKKYFMYLSDIAK